MKILPHTISRSLTAIACLAAASQLAAQQVCPSAMERTRPDSRYEAVQGASPAGSESRA